MNVETVYIREMRRKYRKLTLEEEVELAERSRSGDQKAREALLHSVLAFVVKLAVKYRHRMDFMELISAGNDGALRAVDGLDPSKGRLTTTAYWWIRQAMLRAIYLDGVIRVPTDFVDGAHERTNTFTAEKRRAVRSLRFELKSLNARANRKSDKEIGDFVGDKSQSVVDRIIQNEQREIILAMIDRLPDKLRRIVLMRMDGKHLSEIGRQFGRTKEAVRLSLLKAVQLLQEMRPIEPKETTSNGNRATQASDHLIYSHVPTDVPDSRPSLNTKPTARASIAESGESVGTCSAT